MLCACNEEVTERAAKAKAEAEARSIKGKAELEAAQKKPFQEKRLQSETERLATVKSYETQRVTAIKVRMEGVPAGEDLDLLKMELAQAEKRLADAEAAVEKAKKE